MFDYDFVVQNTYEIRYKLFQYQYTPFSMFKVFSSNLGLSIQIQVLADNTNSISCTKHHIKILSRSNHYEKLF